MLAGESSCLARGQETDERVPRQAIECRGQTIPSEPEQRDPAARTQEMSPPDGNGQRLRELNDVHSHTARSCAR
jgi:hypothetical protein